MDGTRILEEMRASTTVWTALKAIIQEIGQSSSQHCVERSQKQQVEERPEKRAGSHRPWTALTAGLAL
jgi:hypothetical protein